MRRSTCTRDVFARHPPDGAKEAARASFDEVVEIVRDYTARRSAKRQVEQLAVRAAQDFDAFYQQRAPRVIPRTTCSSSAQMARAW